MPSAACTTGESSSPRPVVLRLRCNVANATTTLSLGTVVTARNLSWSFGVRGPLGADGAVARASAPEGLVIRADTSLPCDAGCSPLLSKSHCFVLARAVFVDFLEREAEASRLRISRIQVPHMAAHAGSGATAVATAAVAPTTRGTQWRCVAARCTDAAAALRGEHDLCRCGWHRAGTPLATSVPW